MLETRMVKGSQRTLCGTGERVPFGPIGGPEPLLGLPDDVQLQQPVNSSRIVNSSSKAVYKMSIKSNGFALFGSVVFSLTSSAQNITPISGFHASSETDPFAPKGVLEVTSASTPVAGLNGARAAVTISCREGNPIASFAENC